MATIRGKIQGGMDPLVCRVVTTPHLQEELKRSFQTFLDINKAHVLMLARQGIVGRAAAAAILRENCRMAAMGEVPDFEYDEGLEDIYPNLEAQLIRRVGLEAGGQQHTARSRNDLTVTEERIDARKRYLEVSALLLRLRRLVLRIARETGDAVFAGNTCLQPSEPITMAHYWSGVLNAMQRDAARIAQAWPRLNANPLGGCSMGSTTYPIDRVMTSALLGFDEPMDNSLDCVAAVDYVLELASAFAIAANTLSRVATDLYIWSAPEFGYVEVGDSVAACSSIMPQKKNPVTLEYVRGAAADIEALFVAAWGAAKNTPYTLVVDTYTVAAAKLWPLFDTFEGMLRVLELTLSTLTFRRERMLRLAAGNFCTVTELANALVRKDALSFRQAHDIVGAVVAQALAEGKRADEITSGDVRRTAERFGRAVTLTDPEIRTAMDPARIAGAKAALGGTAPQEVARQLDRQQRAIERDDKELAARASQVSDAKARLEQAVADFLAGSPAQ